MAQEDNAETNCWPELPRPPQNHVESQSLLEQSPKHSPKITAPPFDPPSKPERPQRKSLQRRQSSFAQPRPNGAPRTPNRVRFNVDEPSSAPNGSANSRWIDEEDPLSGEREDSELNGSADVSRLPLLTGIEAPSVTVAGGDSIINPEDHLESARPKSGMKSAFMNMANSIM